MADRRGGRDGHGGGRAGRGMVRKELTRQNWPSVPMLKKVLGFRGTWSVSNQQATWPLTLVPWLGRASGSGIIQSRRQGLGIPSCVTAPCPSSPLLTPPHPTTNHGCPFVVLAGAEPGGRRGAVHARSLTQVQPIVLGITASLSRVPRRTGLVAKKRRGGLPPWCHSQAYLSKAAPREL